MLNKNDVIFLMEFYVKVKILKFEEHSELIWAKITERDLYITSSERRREEEEEESVACRSHFNHKSR